MKKILAIDAVGCLVDFNGKINNKLKKLLQKFKIKKIVLTNADDNEKKIFLKNIKYEVFSLKHKPEKSNPIYFQKFLKKYKIKADELLYFEHDVKACRSARKVGIKCYLYDGNLKKLEIFLKMFLNKTQTHPKKNNLNFHYYPHHPVIIGVNDGNKTNFMPCVWNSALSYEPFLYGISVRNERFTNKLLRKSKYFSINFLEYKHIPFIRSIGRSSGHIINKINEFNIDYSEGLLQNVPVLTNSYLSFECKKQSQNQFGTHTLFVGEIKIIHTDNRISRKNILDLNKIKPTLYLGADHYISLNNKTLLKLKTAPFHKSYHGKKIKLIN